MFNIEALLHLPQMPQQGCNFNGREREVTHQEQNTERQGIGFVEYDVDEQEDQADHHLEPDDAHERWHKLLRVFGCCPGEHEMNQQRQSQEEATQDDVVNAEWNALQNGGKDNPAPCKNDECYPEGNQKKSAKR